MPSLWHGYTHSLWYLRQNVPRVPAHLSALRRLTADCLYKYAEAGGSSSSYCISLNEQLVGGVILWINENNHNFLGNIFIDPAYENRGLGIKVWNMIEKLYPDTEVWETETPVFSSRNHNFYVNKCGFHIVKIDNPKNRLEGQYKMQKVMK